jgi:hypothetical protein
MSLNSSLAERRFSLVGFVLIADEGLGCRSYSEQFGVLLEMCFKA